MEQKLQKSTSLRKLANNKFVNSLNLFEFVHFLILNFGWLLTAWESVVGFVSFMT